MTVGFRFLDGSNDWGWICKQVRLLRVEDTTGIVAVDCDTGGLIGAVVMDTWTPNSVQCHFTMKTVSALRRGLLHKAFEYVFTERDKGIMYGMIPSNNEKSLKLAMHLGFTEQTRLHDTFGTGLDCVILELKRENCPYWIDPTAALEKENGKA